MDLEVIERGAGSRVVLVHGDVFDAETTWSGQEPLAEEYRLLLVNRRGFGNSPSVTGEDFDVDADDVCAVVGAGAHLVGHSYGGVVALLAAARCPASIRSLTVFEPPAFGLVRDHDDVREFISQVEAIMAQRPTPAEFLPRFITAVGGDASRLPDPLPPPLVRAASVQMNGRWPWDARISIDQLAAAGYPKLVISGGHSATFDAVCDLLEEQLAAERAVLPGAGHSIPTLGPPVNDRLATFWKAVDEPA